MSEAISGSVGKKSAVGKRIFLVNRDFQLRYTGAAVIVGLTSTILTIFLILYPLYRFEILRIPRFLPLPILAIMGMAAIINITLVGMLGIIITHKMAGPMYSMVRHLRRIESGIWSGHMRLRKGDEMGYVVRNFNDMIDGLVRIAKLDVMHIDKILESIKSVEKSSDEKLNEVETELRRMREDWAERYNPNR